MRVMRACNLALGGTMLSLAAAGAVLPVLPSTPFLLAAAWFFSRCSPRAEQWLLNHQVFGEPLRNWRRERAVAPRAKALAVGMMGASYIILLITASPDWPLACATAIFLVLVGTFILTRPTPADNDPAGAAR